MAMAYCKTCGAMGNFTQCPSRFEPEEDGTTLLHRVVFDEVYSDNTSDGSPTNDEPGGAGTAGNG